MEVSVLSWNVRGEDERKGAYLAHVLNWVKENWNSGQEVDFIFLQEASTMNLENTLYNGLLSSMGYQVFRFRERADGRGDCYLFAVKGGWQVEEASGYLQVWDPRELCGVPIRSSFYMEVNNGAIKLRLINFHNAFGGGVSGACTRALAEKLKEDPNTPTILAGDFNLRWDEMPDFEILYCLISNRFDHILTSPCMNYICGEALDEDLEGRPVLWEYGENDISSINGSDHCAIFGRYEIPEMDK